jgi:GTP-binding protein
MNYIPSVLLMGRQNVGKSSLFNRLIKTRKAIIDSTPGVTRDLIYGEIEWMGMKFRIIDSGGICDDRDETNSNVQKKLFDAQKNADLILFVVEAGVELPIEKEYIIAIRKQNKKIILVMNKSDDVKKDVLINEFYNYGLGEPIPVSASHNRNIEILKDRIVSELKNINKDSNSDFLDMEPEIKLAILGKPNVGKSSLLNKIVRKERSIVSSIPGTTRDIVDDKFYYKNRLFLILDTAGIRRKKNVVEDLEYYSVKRALKSIEIADLIYLVIDSLEDVSDQDKKIADQIVKSNKGLIIVLNKWDLLKNEKISFEEKKDKLLFKFPVIDYAPIIPVSAVTGEGIDKLLKTSIGIYNELTKRIETHRINDFIQEVIKQYSPSSKKGVLKIYYGTQTSIKPVEFVFFINNKDLLHNNYKQYIINKVREKFGYKGIPIRVLFKDKKEK